jgi:hypothetical protein
MTLLGKLSEKLSDRMTTDRALIWYPRASAIHSAFDSINTYINRLKEDLRKEARREGSLAEISDDREIVQVHIIKNGSGGSLFRQLVTANEWLRRLDPRLSAAFKSDAMANSFNVRGLDSTKFVRRYFQHATPWQALACLAKIQTDIGTLENRMIQFCNNKVDYDPVIFDTASFLIGQNSNIVEGGHSVQIFAGLGSFLKKDVLSIKINGKLVSIDDTGQATYIITSPVKAGKYKVLVEVSYLDQSGRTQVIMKQIEYKVVNELKR